MNTVRARETTRQSFTGVVTRSKRKSSQMIEDSQDTQPDLHSESSSQKKDKNDEDLNDLNDLNNIQDLFSDFIEALNSDNLPMTKKETKNKNQKEILVKRHIEDPQVVQLALKRVKREIRKTRRVVKKSSDLEPIEEDVSKENLKNKEEKEKEDIKLNTTRDYGDSEHTEKNQKDNITQKTIEKFKSKIVNIVDINYNKTLIFLNF